MGSSWVASNSFAIFAPLPACYSSSLILGNVLVIIILYVLVLIIYILFIVQYIFNYVCTKMSTVQQGLQSPDHGQRDHRYRLIAQNLCGSLVSVIGLFTAIAAPDKRYAGFFYFLAAVVLILLAIFGVFRLLRLVRDLNTLYQYVLIRISSDENQINIF